MRPAVAGLVSGLICGALATVAGSIISLLVYPDVVDTISSFLVRASEGVLTPESAKMMILVSLFTNNLTVFMLIGVIGGVAYGRTVRSKSLAKALGVGLLIGLLVGVSNLTLQTTLFGTHPAFIAGFIATLGIWAIYGALLHRLMEAE